MLGEELRPGLRTWTTYHEEWKDTVSSYALLGPGQLVLIDPLLGEDQWPGLEEMAAGRELHVLLTIHWHVRSAAAIRERFPAARVWAHRRGKAAISRRVEPTDLFEPGEELPGGLVAIVAKPRTEVVFWDPAHRALIAGDTLLGDGEEGEGLRTCPNWWLPQSTNVEELREALAPLLDLPVELVLVSHGASISRSAREELARVLSPPRPAP